ncbi:MAG: c-type cytochrome biogenesis protein CcsB [Cyanobacteria bacterium P01_H01_bin.74]
MTAESWEQNWYYSALFFLFIALAFYGALIIKPNPRFKEGGWGCVVLSCLCLIASLFVRSQNAQYFALSNMYESLLTVSIGIHLAFLTLDRWFNLKLLGLPVICLLLFSLFYNLQLPTEIHPLQPALQSYWRSIHVPIILLSYALFTLSFISAIVFLIKDALEPKYQPITENFTLMLGAGGMPERQEFAKLYDEITYRCIAFGVPLLTLGIILGGMWANEAWGNYWSWDPKESMSLVTLLGYGVYLHMRVSESYSAKVLAWVSVIGFMLMLITYFGVNLMGVGLHSYGKIG